MRYLSTLITISLISLNANAMFRRSIVIATKGAPSSAKFSNRRTQECITSCNRRCWLYCKKGHLKLEQAIISGNTGKVRALLATNWVNLQQKNFDGLTLQDLAELHANPEIIALFNTKTK